MDIRSFLEKLDVEAVTDKPMRYLACEKLISGDPLSTLESKRSCSELFNPEESELVPAPYHWKNIRINKNSRVAEFNNKNLKD